MAVGPRSEGTVTRRRSLPPISDLQLLAAVARAQRHQGAKARKPGATVATAARHLGWRYSGATTRRLRPQLAALVASGLLATKELPKYEARVQRWTVSEAGRRLLEEEPQVELPESPQHRFWGHWRDVARWALNGVRADAVKAHQEVATVLADRANPTPAEIRRASSRLARALETFAIASHAANEWPEPSDSAPDSVARSVGDVWRLLPEEAKKGRDKR